MPQRYRSCFFLLALSLLMFTAGWTYAPGLHGGFLFDDFGSLPALGEYGPVTDWATFWRYITSGTADPTGRPLAMLTFLLDAHNWPADPFPFKRTNLILHLINGALLYALLARLGDLLDIETRRTRFAALLGCALWLLHPLLVSTTLYIVQREAMLAATCAMGGMLMWLHGRQQLVEGQLRMGAIWAATGLAGFTLLGTLAKANGLLLPVYVVLVEIIVLIPRRPMPAGTGQRAHQAVMIVFGVVPAAAVITYVMWQAGQGLWLGGPVGVRPWSIAQRLLTEPRVLIDYLELLWLPRPFSSGLFNDQYAASTSWFHPATTLPAMLAVFTLIGGAWWQRQHHPALALAVLFYFAGQLLESSSIPLELYFEHRNYAPALLMFWPLGLWLADIRKMRWIKISLMLALPLMMTYMTHSRAEVWGNVLTQGRIWARINPTSPRAQANAAAIEMRHENPNRAVRQLRMLLTAQPEQAQLALNLIDARCEMGSVDSADVEITRKAMLHTSNIGTLFVRWFERALPIASAESCSGLTPSALVMLIDAGLKNPNLAAAGQQQDMIYLRGRVALSQQRPDVALAEFISALDLLPGPSMALKAAATLGQHGYPEQGLHLLNHYQQTPQTTGSMGLNMATVHQWVLVRQNYWPQEIFQLRNQLVLDAKATRSNTIPLAPPPSTTH